MVQPVRDIDLLLTGEELIESIRINLRLLRFRHQVVFPPEISYLPLDLIGQSIRADRIRIKRGKLCGERRRLRLIIGFLLLLPDSLFVIKEYPGIRDQFLLLIRDGLVGLPGRRGSLLPGSKLRIVRRVAAGKCIERTDQIFRVGNALITGVFD